jgi:hypothetical protein
MTCDRRATCKNGYPCPIAIHLHPASKSIGNKNNTIYRLDRRWGHQKRMLIAIGGDTFANDVQAIVNAFGDRQNFEIARR